MAEESIEVEALTSFVHGSERRRGERFLVSKPHAEALERRGLVQVPGATAKPSPPSRQSRKRTAAAR